MRKTPIHLLGEGKQREDSEGAEVGGGGRTPAGRVTLAAEGEAEEPVFSGK